MQVKRENDLGAKETDRDGILQQRRFTNAFLFLLMF